MQKDSEWKIFRDEDSSSIIVRDSYQWLSIESPRTLIKKVKVGFCFGSIQFLKWWIFFLDEFSF
jgi:hypothetical protein